MESKLYSKVMCHTLNIKIKDIHKDIIDLKSENRAIGDKIRSYMLCVEHNYLTVNLLKYENSYVYLDRVNRDKKTIEYLRKLQEHNSKLIRKHRAKIKMLKTEISVLELYDH